MTDLPPDDQAPKDNNPMLSMAEGAIGMHEMFTAYVSAGFTRPEALHMVTAILVASINNQQNDN